jgi:hypothetical protein
VRPLVVVDTQSVSWDEHVYRHSNGNDLMLLGFAESQRIYYKPRMRLGEAAVFLTGATPHSSASLPGEECLSKSCNLTESEIDPDVRHLLTNVSRDQWRRESLEMRCAVLVISENVLLAVQRRWRPQLRGRRVPQRDEWHRLSQIPDRQRLLTGSRWLFA